MKAIFTSIAAGLLSLSAAPGQEPAADPYTNTEDELAFGEAVRNAETALRAAEAYSLSVATEWESISGDHSAKGANRLTVITRKPDRLFLELKATENPDVRYVAACNGETLTRYFAAANVHAQSRCSTPSHDLQSDAVTIPMLRATGCEFIVAPDIHGAVMAQAIRVNDLGVREVGDRNLRCFAVHLVNGKDIEIRFATEGPPMPVELVSTLKIALDEESTATTELRSTLTWDLHADPEAAVFAFKTPDGSEQVENLAEELFGQAAADLIGRAAPEVKLVDLDGKEISIAQRRGDGALVIFFWASWSVPEESELATLREIVKSAEGKGVSFLAANVGESAEAVKAHAEEREYRTPLVRDPRGEALHAFRASVPSAVVIDRDGQLRAITRGVSPEAIGQLRQVLDSLGKE